MNIEYHILNIDCSENEIKEKIRNVLQYDIKIISVPQVYSKLCKNLTKDVDIIMSTPIDYPLGLNDTESRCYMVEQAIKNGFKQVNIVIQNHYLSNKKYDKIKYDVQKIYEISQKNNIRVNYYIDYRIFTHQSLIKACSILLENGIKNVYVSTNYFIDNPDDNMIATILLRDKTGINSIFTANVWTTRHVDNLVKNNIIDIVASSIESIKLFCDKGLTRL
jgi:deoxyribose-phosphate aldolase